MARFFLSTAEHDAFKQNSKFFSDVATAVASMVEGVKTEDVTSDMVLELLNNSESEGDMSNDLKTANDTIEALKQAETNLIAQLDALDPSVKNAADPTAKVAAITAKLAERPGSKIESPQGDSSANNNNLDEVDQDGIDELAHNKLADKVL